jgi:general secretion pathway protein D
MLFRCLAWLGALLALAMAGTIPASAQDADTVTLNFVNADIDAVVKAVGEITGRNFLVDPRVKGTVNIVSSRPVAKALVYPTLLSALRMQGFAAVEADGVVKIVPEADAKTQASPVQRGAITATGERIVTQVIALRYESAAQLVTVLRPRDLAEQHDRRVRARQRDHHHRLRRQPEAHRPDRCVARSGARR